MSGVKNAVEVTVTRLDMGGFFFSSKFDSFYSPLHRTWISCRKIGMHVSYSPMSDAQKSTGVTASRLRINPFS